MRDQTSPCRRRNDVRKLIVARALRSYAYGSLSVVLALYLAEIGFSAAEIGLFLTAAIIGSTVTSLLWAAASLVLGRRRCLVLLSLVMTVAGVVLVISDNIPLLFGVALVGGVSASSADLGAANMLDQSMLPQLAGAGQRTKLFSVYNLYGSLAASAGALSAGSVELLQRLWLDGADAYRPILLLYAVLGLVTAHIVSRLSSSVELEHGRTTGPALGDLRPRGRIVTLSAIFAVDAVAGGFVIQTLVVLWFTTRWDLALGTLAVLVFLDGLIGSLMMRFAASLSRRFGLIQTMVGSQCVVGILWILLPLAPAPWLAITLFLLRGALAQLDVPTRQSYTMAISAAAERTAAAGITNLARTGASGLSAGAGGVMFGISATGLLPFACAGAVKIVAAFLLLGVFGSRRPPEERS